MYIQSAHQSNESMRWRLRRCKPCGLLAACDYKRRDSCRRRRVVMGLTKVKGLCGSHTHSSLCVYMRCIAYRIDIFIETMSEGCAIVENVCKGVKYIASMEMIHRLRLTHIYILRKVLSMLIMRMYS